MSYILDALKKSEKERQQGMVPDLMTVQDVMAQEQKKRPLLPYLLLVALLLNVALLTWWLVPWQSKKPGIELYPVVRQQPSSKTGEFPPPDLTKTFSSGVKVSKEEPVSEEGKTIPKKEAKSESIVLQKQPVQASADLQEQTTDKPSPTIETGNLREASPFVTQQTRTIRQVPSEAKTTNKSVASDKNKIYNLDDLPLPIQQSLPTITISVFLYSDDPDSRMSKINGLMMHEGEYLTAGLKLEEITTDGVIFSYQSYRFRVVPK
jgi:general secretion pathway protein B